MCMAHHGSTWLECTKSRSLVDGRFPLPCTELWPARNESERGVRVSSATRVELDEPLAFWVNFGLRRVARESSLEAQVPSWAESAVASGFRSGADTMWSAHG